MSDDAMIGRGIVFTLLGKIGPMRTSEAVESDVRSGTKRQLQEVLRLIRL